MSCSCCGSYSNKCTGCSCRHQNGYSHECGCLKYTHGFDGGEVLSEGREVEFKEAVWAELHCDKGGSLMIPPGMIFLIFPYLLKFVVSVTG